MRGGDPSSGYADAHTNSGGRGPGEQTAGIASRIHPWPVPLRYHHGSCLDVPVPSDARGFVVYADPSYRATTGYKSNIYAEDLKDYLMSWSEAGATVAVSEARPLDEVFPGWHVVRIDGERRGQKRTWGSTPEYLTLNREPTWRPSFQTALFEGEE
jgi:hypothetical protein